MFILFLQRLIKLIVSSKIDKKRRYVELVSAMKERISLQIHRNPKDSKRNKNHSMHAYKFDKLGEMDQFLEIDLIP